ncbi:MAG: TraR/DksA family transcriptional regulator [Sciscionella sp.]
MNAARRRRVSRDRSASTGAGGEPGGVEAAALLASARTEALDWIEALNRQLAGIVESSGAETNDDEHDPEGATIAFERAQVQALLQRAKSDLREVEEARHRLDHGSYGRCEHCGKPIARLRLLARPAARTCIACAERARR